MALLLNILLKDDNDIFDEQDGDLDLEFKNLSDHDSRSKILADKKKDNIETEICLQIYCGNDEIA